MWPVDNFAAIDGPMRKSHFSYVAILFVSQKKNIERDLQEEKETLENDVNTHFCLDFDVAYIRTRPIEISIHSIFDLDCLLVICVFDLYFSASYTLTRSCHFLCFLSNK